MKPRRILWILVAVVLLAGLGLFSGKLFSRDEEVAEEETPVAAVDSAIRAAWEKGAPSLFKGEQRGFRHLNFGGGGSRFEGCGFELLSTCLRRIAGALKLLAGDVTVLDELLSTGVLPLCLLVI